MHIYLKGGANILSSKSLLNCRDEFGTQHIFVVKEDFTSKEDIYRECGSFWTSLPPSIYRVPAKTNSARN
jgi:hypothetical protein